MRRTGAVLAFGLVLANVASSQDIDLAAARAAIQKADEEFSKATEARNRDAFLTFIADEATFSSGATVSRGKDEVARSWAPMFTEGGPTLTWRPAHVEVIPAGDVGVSIGAYERRGVDATGKPVATRGNYVTVWRKQSDGRWKVVFDTGSPQPPAKP